MVAPQTKLVEHVQPAPLASDEDRESHDQRRLEAAAQGQGVRLEYERSMADQANAHALELETLKEVHAKSLIVKDQAHEVALAEKNHEHAHTVAAKDHQHRVHVERLEQDMRHRHSNLLAEEHLNATALRLSLDQVQQELDAQKEALQRTDRRLQASEKSRQCLELQLKQRDETIILLTRGNKALGDETDVLRTDLRQLKTLRRQMCNTIVELRGNIRVYCRIRPALGTVDPAPSNLQIIDRSNVGQACLAVVEEVERVGLPNRVNRFDFQFGAAPAFAPLPPP